MISSARSAEISSRPVSLPAVESVPELSRGIGIHESSSSLLRVEAEGVGAALVVESVEEDADVILAWRVPASRRALGSHAILNF
jgi:hypothetical protein